jgi:hypothetical protein
MGGRRKKMLLLLNRSNVQVVLAADEAEASRIVFGCGATPRFTIVVNGALHETIDGFLKAVPVIRGECLRAGNLRTLVDCVGVPLVGALAVARFDIGSTADLSGWDVLDAVLMAPSFQMLVEAIDEYAESSG